jgi:sterol-4alpha-carboxylate 3-dehydrogenase (decarboxylating)
LASLFIVFIVYEQCEEEIDSLASYAFVKIKWLMDRVVERLPVSVKAYIS